MKTIVDLVNNNTGWLYVKILETSFFFLDFWSFAHFWTGGVVIAILSVLKWKHKWMLLFIFLMMYEVIEISILFSALNIFKPEIIKDQFTDIFVGMAGGFLFDKWLRYYASNKKQEVNIPKSSKIQIALFTAFTISFIWVGFYKYEYNVPMFNSLGLNYTAFLFWSFGILATIITYERLALKFKKVHAFVLLWFIYLAGLCVIESISYHIIGLKETGPHVHKALFFDIIHGTVVLHVFYLLVPFISVIIYSLFCKLFNNAIMVKRSEESFYSVEKYDKIVRSEMP
jgi:hypothetical protein